MAAWPDNACGRLCREREMRAPWYRAWCERLGERPRFNRKQWEHLAIAEAAQVLGLLRPGARALGFGVGAEPLPALFAGAGCSVVATDLAVADGGDGWARSGQHLGSLDQLQLPAACPPEELRRLVAVQAADMRRIPDGLRGFDVTWSSCALEHLGSLEAGLRFLIEQARCLKPGGFGIHTTEYNVLSPERTWSAGGTVAYRARDLADLATACARAGLVLLPVDLAPGDGDLDWTVDTWPWRPEPHLKLLAEGAFVLTSLLLVVHRPADCAEVGDPGPILTAAPEPQPGPDGWLLPSAPAAERSAGSEADLWRLRYLAASGEEGAGSERIAALSAECRRWREAYERLAGHPVVRPLLWLRRRLHGRSEQTTR